jgi:hypothetical protein
MPLFVCARCSSLDNTATSGYWRRLTERADLICTACATGSWHDLFPRRQYDPAVDGAFRWTDRLLIPR